MDTMDLIWTAVGFALSLLVFSYLIGDNPLFRLAISLFTGVTAGYMAIIILFQVIYPRLIYPMFSSPFSAPRLILQVAIPTVLSIFLLFVPHPKLSFLGRIPLAILFGSAAAFAISGAVLGTILPQTQATINLFDPSILKSNWMEAVVITVSAISTLMYFYFGAKLEIGKPLNQPGVVRIFAVIGRLFLFITLGAILAGVFTTAITALVERLHAFWQIISIILK
jgi:hypothetical protein